ncbi:MAG: two-component system nitrogen regulation sensor histidine kinase NtrY [Alteromonadaceae bacterium]
MHKTDSLERYLQFKLLWFFIPIGIFFGLWTWQIALKWQWILLGELSLFFICLSLNLHIKTRVLKAFTRATLHLDAIGQEDYNQFAKSSFSTGKVKEFHQQLKKLSGLLQQQKSRYDQHAFLVYQLIGQLEAPILVFDNKQQLTFGNEAFSLLFKRPWQMLRHASAELLGLELVANNWHFIASSQRKKWQIRKSEFIDDGQTHQLLVFIDIESALRENQLNAWQQIIRVLTHEIRNSLTPVSSMAETLADKTDNERDKMVLNVITDRCSHLQNFVSRYSSLSQQYQLNCQWLSVVHVMKAVAKMYNQIKITTAGTAKQIWADGEFFEQVLINLIKNAQEAGATEVSLNFDQQEQFTVIDVVDDGHGFNNLENLFVPLYTTKPQGQGIGLNFCRSIIEQHHGVLELHNNETQGVTVMIILPIPAIN